MVQNTINVDCTPEMAKKILRKAKIPDEDFIVGADVRPGSNKLSSRRTKLSKYKNWYFYFNNPYDDYYSVRIGTLDDLQKIPKLIKLLESLNN